MKCAENSEISLGVEILRLYLLNLFSSLTALLFSRDEFICKRMLDKHDILSCAENRIGVMSCHLIVLPTEPRDSSYYFLPNNYHAKQFQNYFGTQTNIKNTVPHTSSPGIREYRDRRFIYLDAQVRFFKNNIF
jgi:hypothetical protein